MNRCNKKKQNTAAMKSNTFTMRAFKTGRLLQFRFAFKRPRQEKATEMDVSGKHRSTAELSPHRRSAIRTSPRCLEGEGRRRRWFCLTGLRRGETFFQPRCKKLTQPQAGNTEARLPQVPAAGTKRTTKVRIREQQTDRNMSRLTLQGHAGECGIMNPV